MVTYADLQAANHELFARHVSVEAFHQACTLQESGRFADLRALLACNVHGTGIGYKVSARHTTDTLCVQLFVHQKVPQTLLDETTLLPACIDGIPTDIVASPPVYPCGGLPGVPAPLPATDHVPLRPGMCAAHKDVSSGTMGCFCTAIADPDTRYLLSANHVLADCNAGQRGDPIYQPSPFYGGLVTDTVATLTDFYPLTFGANGANEWDGAIAQILPGIQAENRLPDGRHLLGASSGTLDMPVAKVGAETGCTLGTIESTDHHFVTTYPTSTGKFTVRFINQLRILVDQHGSFAKRGDSGAVIFDRASLHAVGILFASDEKTVGVACPIQPLLNHWQLTLAP